jgi:adenylate cyclase class IV
MYSEEIVKLMDEIQTELDELLYYSAPKRQMLTTDSVHLRLKKLTKTVQRLQMQMLIHGPKHMAEDIKKARKKQVQNKNKKNQ